MSVAEVKPGIENPLLRWLAAAAVVGVSVGFLYWLYGLVGFRSFWFAFNLHFLAMGAAHMLHRIFKPALTSRYFEVSPWEPRVYRWVGVLCCTKHGTLDHASLVRMVPRPAARLVRCAD